MALRHVTIAGTGFYGYLDSIAAAFRRNGVAATAIAYPNVRNGWRSLPSRVGIMALENGIRRRVLKRLLRAGQQSELVLLIRGDLLQADDLEQIKSRCGAKVALWAIDSVHRMRRGPELCQKADILFLYNREEINESFARAKPAFFAPLAFDEAYYRPLASVAKDIDLYYVGTFHSDRKAMLDEVIGTLGRDALDIVVDGRVLPRHRPFMREALKREFPHLLSRASDRVVTHEHINVMTNRARICLNCLPDQATSALNTRTFEICGSGGFQLVSRNSVLGQHFEEGTDVEAFSDVQELVAKIRFFLDPSQKSKREVIASRGHECARSRHTFDQRIRELISKIGTSIPG